MNFDLFGPNISDADIAAFRKKGAGYLLTGTILGDLAIVPNETKMFRKVVHYTPEEIRCLLELSVEEAKKLHKMKKLLGGYIKASGL